MSELISCIAADDEPLFLDYLKKIIPWEEYGFFLCACASDGYEALSLIKKYRPQVLLIDINMPKLSGLELLEKIADQEYYPPCCIIISGYRTFEYAHTAIRLSVEDYLVKPFTGEELLKCLLSVRKKLASLPNPALSAIPPHSSQPPVLLETSQYRAILEENSRDAGLSRSRALLKKALAYLYEHYPEELTLDSIASALYVSQSYLRKVFFNEIHSSVGVVLEDVRLEKACELLEKNMYYISDIAEMTGYHNPTYFTKVFKRRFQMTPSQYAVLRSLEDHKE